MVRPEGFEPPAYRFEACRSIQLSYGRIEARANIKCSAQLPDEAKQKARTRLPDLAACAPCLPAV